MIASKDAQIISPAQLEKERHYQVRIDSTDVPGMINTVMRRLPWLKTLATLHGQRLQKDLPPPLGFSLRDINLRRFKTEIFEPVLGSAIIAEDLLNSNQNLAKFYTPERVFLRKDGAIELRGPNYFVALDSQRRDPVDKAEVLRQDLIDGLKAIHSINREDITDEKGLLLYLGVLDYLKNQSVTIFNSLTYPERDLSILPENPNNSESDPKLKEYYNLRKEAIALMRRFTRMYYQTCLGLPFDQNLDIDKLTSSINNLTGFLSQTLREEEFYRFTYPEVNHPLVILLGAQEAALKNPAIDTIIGIPSGGTESAIAIQLAYELLHRKTPELFFVPLSLHSKYHDPLMPHQLDQILKLYNQYIQGKNILLVDDNSNTGSTLQMLSEAVTKAGAIRETAQLMQHDPRRVLNKYDKRDKLRHRFPEAYLFRINHDNYTATMGEVKLTAGNIDLCKAIISQKLDDYYSQEDSGNIK